MPDYEQPPQQEVTMGLLEQTSPEVAAELKTILVENPLEKFTQETGLGLTELSTVVSYQTKEGLKTAPLAAVLLDGKCPLGEMVKNRFEKQGLEGVQRMTDDWRVDMAGVDVKISPSAWQRETERLETREPITTPSGVEVIDVPKHDIEKKKLISAG